LPSLFLELHRAYLDARKHKRNTINQLKFERNLETELLFLCSELETRTLNAISSIRSFMRDRLNLALHPKKIKLQPATKGFAFLGAYI